ncbi:hypothetical protein ISS06_01325 [Patescibacteria group bacterium]|nr:hypothetical protein [Patescibacteria group bacterium]
MEFKDLPDWVKDNLLSDQTLAVNKKIIKDFELTNEQKSIVFDALRKIILKQSNIDELTVVLQGMGVGIDKANKLIIEVIKQRLLPLKEYLLIDFRPSITKLGGKILKEQSSQFVPDKEISLEKTAQQIIDELKISFERDVMATRFSNIVVSFLKEVRSEIETKIVLKRDPKIGGMGIEDEMVDKIIQALKKKHQSPKIIKNTKVKDLTEELKLAQEPIDIPGSIPKPQPKPDLGARPLSKDMSQEKQVLTPKPYPVSQPKPDLGARPLSKDMSQEKQVLTPKPYPVSQPKPDLGARPLSKPLVHQTPRPVKDLSGPVEIRSRTLSPIDELRTFSLVDWRRLGKTADAVTRIKDKINLLEEESLLKKAEGIKAWKESTINKLYLKIGEQAINSGSSIRDVILSRQSNKEQTLTEEEFNAVVELNQSLRF